MLWAAATGASIALLAFVVAQVDWDAARDLVHAIDYRWVFVGIAALLAEGVVTATRFRLLARGGATLRDCFLATAWYVVMLIGLPARLGEVAGIAVIVRTMQQPAGIAAASLLFQRVFDMFVLAALLTLIAMLALGGAQSSMVALAGIGLVVVLAALLILLEPLLACVARALRDHRHDQWRGRLLRLVLQARMFSRHHMTRERVVGLGALTLLKWTMNLTGIALVVVAVVPGIPVPTALGLGIVYNLSAVIPIQTVGGFGISEAVLLGSFKWLGYAVGIGAPIAIAIRLALISAPVLFWILVMSLTTLTRARPVPRRTV